MKWFKIITVENNWIFSGFNPNLYTRNVLGKNKLNLCPSYKFWLEKSQILGLLVSKSFNIFGIFFRTSKDYNWNLIINS